MLKVITTTLETSGREVTGSHSNEAASKSPRVWNIRPSVGNFHDRNRFHTVGRWKTKVVMESWRREVVEAGKPKPHEIPGRSGAND